MAGSLLDNDDFSSIGSSGGGTGGGSSIDKGNVAKIVVIVACLGGAGLLFAYQAGLIFQGKSQVVQKTQEEIDLDDAEFEKQERFREELEKLPGYERGDA